MVDRLGQVPTDGLRSLIRVVGRWVIVGIVAVATCGVEFVVVVSVAVVAGVGVEVVAIVVVVIDVVVVAVVVNDVVVPIVVVVAVDVGVSSLCSLCLTGSTMSSW